MSTLETLELKIAKFLRAGVIVAGVLMLIGWLSQIKFSANTFFNFQTYDEIPLMDLLKLHLYREHWGVLISYLGLVVLIGLPLIRVFLTTYLFIRQKEFALATIAVIVFAGLIFSMSLGIEL